MALSNQVRTQRSRRIVFTFHFLATFCQMAMSAIIPFYTNLYGEVATHSVGLVSANIGLALFSFIFVCLTFCWKEPSVRDYLRVLAYLIIFLVRLVALILALFGHKAVISDLSCIPFMFELIGVGIETWHDHLIEKRLQLIWGFIGAIVLILGESAGSVYMSLTHHKPLWFMVVNWIVSILSFLIVIVFYYLRSKTTGVTGNDNLRVYAFFLVFVARSGMLFYACATTLQKKTVKNIDFTCIPFVVELGSIWKSEFGSSSEPLARELAIRKEIL
ncbi:OLC1v1019739C1 [Oldenlandia corymbosa var. corymbosa]|uniref:OLC1v1019739C1 n=1 Tax=Oldenlandia corymbosa var. corymbosa TaxID=529605 RepID=A0AAV1EEU1_OLDCO|nr:OLC1v1019739C1 [Oldenlandia corymbosa var. corymbosa]